MRKRDDNVRSFLSEDMIRIIFEMDATRTDLWKKVIHQLQLKNVFREVFYRTLLECSHHQYNNIVYHERLMNLQNNTNAWILRGRYFFFWNLPNNNKSGGGNIKRKCHSMSEQQYERHVHLQNRDSKYHNIVDRFCSQALERFTGHRHSHYHL